MAEVWDTYMQQRLVDAALGRRGTSQACGEGTARLREQVEQVDAEGHNFRVTSEKDASKVYDVDLQLGWCSCVKGNTGAVCKHQTACAEFAMASLPQVFVATKERRQWLAAVAMGADAAPPVDFFAGLTEKEPTVSGDGAASAAEPAVSPSASHAPASDSAAVDASDDDFVDAPPNSAPPPALRVEKPSPAVLDELLSTLRDTATALGDGLTDEGARRMTARLRQMRTGAQLNSAMFCFGSTVATSGGGGRKIRCQPASISRRREGVPRGAAPVAKGRPPKASQKAARKRVRNLAVNVALNRANARSHGSGH